MVKVIFTFNVAKEKQEGYLKASAERIKPFWESRGCQSYQVWQAEGETTFIKEMLFTDVDSKERIIGAKDDEANAARSLWRSFITDLSLKTFERKM